MDRPCRTSSSTGRRRASCGLRCIARTSATRCARRRWPKSRRELDAAQADTATRVVVLTGGLDCFAAGADVREMAPLGPVDILTHERQRHWRTIATFPKPLVGAVCGYALGGGCELALCCDILVAGNNAQVRAAGSEPRHDPGRRRHAAARAHRRQGADDADGADRAADRRAGGARRRPGRGSRRAGERARARRRNRVDHRHQAGARRAPRQGSGAARLSKRR